MYEDEVLPSYGFIDNIVRAIVLMPSKISNEETIDTCMSCNIYITHSSFRGLCAILH